MGHADEGFAAISELGKGLHHLPIGARIEAAGHLIKKQHPRFGDQLCRQTHALQLTAAQRRRRINQEFGLRLQTYAVQHFIKIGGDFMLGGIVRQAQSRGIFQRPPQLYPAVYDVLLGHVADARAVHVERRVEIDTVIQNPPSGGRSTPAQGVEQGRLAAAAAAEDHHELAGLNDQRDVLQQLPGLTSRALAHRFGKPQCFNAHPALFTIGPQAIACKAIQEGRDTDPIANIESHRQTDPPTVDEGAVDAAQIFD